MLLTVLVVVYYHDVRTLAPGISGFGFLSEGEEPQPIPSTKGLRGPGALVLGLVPVDFFCVPLTDGFISLEPCWTSRFSKPAVSALKKSNAHQQRLVTTVM